jgi:DNA repair protein RadA/Sms
VAKAATQFACTDCGYSAGRWFGKCPRCGEFGTLVEDVPADARANGPQDTLRLVDVNAEEADRIPTGVPELDRVLGGGLVPARSRRRRSSSALPASAAPRTSRSSPPPS